MAFVPVSVGLSADAPGPRWRAVTASVALALAAGGCASVMQPVDAGAPACSVAIRDAFSSILLEQDETPENAAALANRAQAVLGAGRIGPRPFTVSSPSGADYGFFFTGSDNACVLRLYMRQRGFTRLTNNLGGIASRPVAGCRCQE